MPDISEERSESRISTVKHRRNSRHHVLHQNFVDIIEESKSSTLNDFFLYTSIGGLRFLHSENPKWFR